MLPAVRLNLKQGYSRVEECVELKEANWSWNRPTINVWHSTYRSPRSIGSASEWPMSVWLQPYKSDLYRGETGLLRCANWQVQQQFRLEFETAQIDSKWTFLSFAAPLGAAFKFPFADTLLFCQCNHFSCKVARMESCKDCLVPSLT